MLVSVCRSLLFVFLLNETNNKIIAMQKIFRSIILIAIKRKMAASRLPQEFVKFGRKIVAVGRNYRLEGISITCTVHSLGSFSGPMPQNSVTPCPRNHYCF